MSKRLTGVKVKKGILVLKLKRDTGVNVKKDTGVNVKKGYWG